MWPPVLCLGRSLCVSVSSPRRSVRCALLIHPETTPIDASMPGRSQLLSVFTARMLDRLTSFPARIIAADARRANVSPLFRSALTLPPGARCGGPPADVTLTDPDKYSDAVAGRLLIMAQLQHGDGRTETAHSGRRGANISYHYHYFTSRPWAVTRSWQLRGFSGSQFLWGNVPWGNIWGGVIFSGWNDGGVFLETDFFWYSLVSCIINQRPKVEHAYHQQVYSTFEWCVFQRILFQLL